MSKLKKKKYLIISVAFLLIAAFCIWQNNMLTVTEYVCRSEKVTEELAGFRIVQLSDLHNKSFGGSHKRLISAVAELSPDLIVFTGDQADSTFTNTDTPAEIAAECAKIAPVYYITGNHEYWLDDGELAELHEKMQAAGAVYLSDESAEVAGFVLTGVDDWDLENFAVKCPPLDDSRLNILLAHEPQYIDDYSSFGGVDIALTGHAHGGQVVLPFVGGVIAPDQGLFPEYVSGVHERGGMKMVISRGLGNSVIPVRIFNYPEIVCVELQK